MDNSGILAQEAQPPAEAQPRPRWQLVQELRKAASKTSTDFWVWWWKLTKEERRTLLDAMA